MGTIHRGFIPLMAILLLSLVAVAGGAFAIVSSHDAATKSTEGVATSTSQDRAVSPSILPPTETSAATKAPQPVSAKPALVRADLSPKSRAICEEAMREALPSKQSLIGSIQTLCLRLDQEAENTPEQQEAWVAIENSLGEKWSLWLKTQGRTQ
jgi:hypothetical protein